VFLIKARFVTGIGAGSPFLDNAHRSPNPRDVGGGKKKNVYKKERGTPSAWNAHYKPHACALTQFG